MVWCEERMWLLPDATAVVASLTPHDGKIQFFPLNIELFCLLYLHAFSLPV